MENWRKALRDGHPTPSYTQIYTLRDLGYDGPIPKTAKEASELIEELKRATSQDS